MKKYVDLVLDSAKKPLTIENIYGAVNDMLQDESDDFLGFNSEIKKSIDEVISQGIENYEYLLNSNNEYIAIKNTSWRKGMFFANKGGAGYVVVFTSNIDQGKIDFSKEKYSVSRKDVFDAVDGDLVLINISGPNAKIEKILDRNIDNVVGIVVRDGNNYFLRPIDKKLQNLKIFLDESVVEGQVVSVSLKKHSSDNSYIGNVIKVFGHKESPYGDVLWEAISCGMPTGFSKESFDQLSSIPFNISEKDKVGRYDFTDWEIFSIDGIDTKDKDDCISLKILPNGNYLLGVHIADPPHYIPFGSSIDRDAFRKGNSYYYGVCVEPMLHYQLSKGICSLHDDVERLTKSILLEIDNSGNVVNRWLVPSVIKSRIGMNYDNVNQLLNGENSSEDYKKYESTLLNMAKVYSLLIKKRLKNGAIILNKFEPGFNYDGKGRPISVKVKKSGLAEGIIQEFMLCANVNVLEILEENGIPCIYRVHDVVVINNLSNYLLMLKVLGIPFSYTAKEIFQNKKVFQRLIEHISDRGPLSNMLTTNLIKCMSHAEYSVNNIGHYGTGFKIYGQFTSPIRRLSDYAISRIIDECYFEKDETIREKNKIKWKEIAPYYALQASKMERVADNVERSVFAMETAEYFGQYVGKVFDATIISVSDNNIVVQFDSLLEGSIKVKELPGKYVYNPKKFSLFSNDGYDDYHVGDRLKVKLVSANKYDKTVNFSIISKINNFDLKNRKETYVKSLSKKRGK